jgi:putative transposase
MRIVTRVTRQVQVSAGDVRDQGYQAVWCPRYRRPLMADRVTGRCEELTCAKASGHGWRMVALAIMPGHVHLFVKAHRSDSPSRIVSQFQDFTSGGCGLASHTCGTACRPCGSQSCCAAAAGAVSAQAVCRFTGTQRERRWRQGRSR